MCGMFMGDGLFIQWFLYGTFSQLRENFQVPFSEFQKLKKQPPMRSGLTSLVNSTMNNL